MNAIVSGLGRLLKGITHPLRVTWRRYRGLRKRYQWAIGLGLVILILGISMFGGEPAVDTGSYERTVTLAPVASLSGGAGTGNVLGTVRSVTEAEILSQTSGTVRRVNVSLGSSVGAGAVLAELENASERAAVLQAEGAYDATVAANTVSTKDVTTDIRSTYQTAFTALDTALEVQIDSLFADPTPTSPSIEGIAGWETAQELRDARRSISYQMNAWRKNLSNTGTADPNALLNEMESVLTPLSSFVVELARSANRQESGATAAQIANLSAARETIASLSTRIAGLRNDYEAQRTAASSGMTSANEAAVKQALGSLRLAQAALEKTVVRAPIAGTVNFFPIRTGDYVTSFTHVATVAQNGALEVVAYISEDERAALAVGDSVTVDGAHTGVVTSIAPALDPVTKQIEMRVAVAQTEGNATLVNGQSVRISIPTVAASSSTTGPILLPLSAVKLSANSRVVFTVNEEGRLVAQTVETGEVRGDRIEILSPLSGDLRIVTDARGLAEGEKVKLSTGP